MKLLLPVGGSKLVTSSVALAAVVLCWLGTPPSVNTKPAVPGAGVVLAGMPTIWLPVWVEDTFTVIEQVPGTPGVAMDTLPPREHHSASSDGGSQCAVAGICGNAWRNDNDVISAAIQQRRQIYRSQR